MPRYDVSDLFQLGHGILTNLGTFYQENSDMCLVGDPISVYHNDTFKKKDDPDGVKLEALSRLMETAIEHTNRRMPDAFKIDVQSEFGYTDTPDGKTEDVLMLYARLGHKELFAAWLQQAYIALEDQQQKMKLGWRKENRGGMEWYVHPLHEKAVDEPLAPLVILVYGEGLPDARNDPRFQCRQPTRFNMLEECHVRADAIDQFLKPAGIAKEQLLLKQEQTQIKQR